MPSHLSAPDSPPPWLTALTVAAALVLMPIGTAHAAKSKIAISQAAWFPKTQQFRLKGTSKSASQSIEVFDTNGRRLASANGAKFNVTLGADTIPTVPCAVRVQAGNDEAVLAVKGAPKACLQAPTCAITAPTHGTALKVGVETHFQASAATKDKKALPLKYEWDFAGGSMGEVIPGTTPPAFKRPTDLMAMVSFVRDNSTYRVRFAATDAKGRRCEDSVLVTVGTPPAGLPAKVAEQAAPKLGSELEGKAGDVVVMPFEEWTMQHATDARFTPDLYSSFDPLISNLNAYVYQKARLPVVLGSDRVELRYSAASNPADPVGGGSINSTSQNWPLNADITQAAPLMTSQVQKTDQWEKAPVAAGTKLASDHFNWSWMEWLYAYQNWVQAPSGWPRVDEGYFPHAEPKPEYFDGFGEISYYQGMTPAELADTQKSTYDAAVADYNVVLGLQPPGATHGAYLPGVANPYRGNDAQPFPARDSGSDWFSIRTLPLTDIDDQGRVNPYPLLRVEAVQKGAQTVLAKTDGVLSNSRDFHCRECHAKGKIAANPNAGHTAAAFHASPAGQASEASGHSSHTGPAPAKPDFFDATSASLFDQEYAAALNYSSLHQFYDSMGFLDTMLHGIEDDNGLHWADGVQPCNGCHLSPLMTVARGSGWWGGDWGFYEERDYANASYDPNYSISMHRFHAEMQYNADKSDIVRDEKGMYKRFDWKSVTTRTPGKDINPNTLFPIFDANGKQLPMEQNCLRCHGGHREPLYRDRMYTAGVTCFDCHGDMLAVGQAFTKDPAKLGSTKRADYRVPFFDETDCGSCHVGTGNVGKGSGDFFSAGVRKTAFEATDLAANSRPVDKSDPNAARFAVLPNYKKEFPSVQYIGDITDETPTKIDAPLYRQGKDTHGNVACAACHGSAHAVWPNRDPSSNDNVTALQLQGHTGTIHECNVCHTADSFKLEDDLDGGVYSGDPIKGILGGPHNMHPINDPFWWKEAPGDAGDATPNKNGKVLGGWHNNYAKKPGKDGEDQCAACHGADHQGTRLSKTPVDREFVNEKGKKVSVAAGTPIACDLCHSLEKSFTGSPGK